MEGDHLYGLPLERFIPERTALAKSLRAEGRRVEAEQVAKLRKPSVAAWAVNQLVRTQRTALDELLAAGDGLVQAQADVVAGAGDGRSLRAAAERERTAVEALLAAARGLLTSDGDDLSPAIIDRVADTLHAAALDEAAREQVREGRLERELRHVGLGSGELPAAASAPAAPPARKKPAKAEAGARRRAEREAADARRRAERAERALRAAAEARDRAARQLEEAEEALAQAEAEAEAAAQAHRAADQRLDRPTR
jgi:hypothetical protein